MASRLGYEVLSKEKIDALTKLAEEYFNKGGKCDSDYLVGAWALLRSHDVFGFYARIQDLLDCIPIIELLEDDGYNELMDKQERKIMSIRMDMANYPQIFRILNPYPEKVLHDAFSSAKKAATRERSKLFIQELETLRKEIDQLEVRDVD